MSVIVVALGGNALEKKNEEANGQNQLKNIRKAVKKIADLIESVIAFDGERIFELQREQLNFSYRNSHLERLVVLGGVLRLFNRDSDEILKEMNENLQKRKDSQPYDMPSLGSVFKRICGDEVIYPAKLIDSLALKGVKIGGVEVSSKHAGFIVNGESGTAKDFEKLVKLVEKKVLKKYNIKLEREVVYLSEKERE